MNKELRIHYLTCIITIVFVLLNYLNVFLLELNINPNPLYFFLIYMLIWITFLWLLVYEIFYIKTKTKVINIVFIIWIFVFIVWNILFFSKMKLLWSHDPGSYLSYGVEIVKNGSLEFTNHFLNTYPSFWFSNNNNALSQFPPLYPLYMWNFFFILWMKWFAIWNLILFLWTLYFILKIWELLFNNKNFIFYFILFFVFSYFTIVFTRAGYIENILIFYIWWTIFFFLNWFKSWKIYYLFFALLLNCWIILIRFEFFIYVFWLISAFLFSKIVFKTKLIYKNIFLTILAFLFSLFILYVWYYYYRFINLNWFISTFNEIIWVWTQWKWIVSIEIEYSETRFTLLYIIVSFLLSLYGFYLLLSLKFIKNNFKIFIILWLLIFPQILFLYRPWIAFYYPWFMRRFRSWLVVLIIFAFSMYISLNKQNMYHLKKKIIYLFVLINFIYTLNVFFLNDWKNFVNLFDQIAWLSNNKDDIYISIDSYWVDSFGTILWNYYNKKAIVDRLPLKNEKYYWYLMNKYKNNDIFILTSSKDINSLQKYFKNDTITFVTDLNYNYDESGLFCDIRPIITLRDKFESYYQIFKYCNTLDYKIYNKNLSVKIYKMKNLWNLESVDKVWRQDWRFDDWDSLRQ